MSGERGRLGVGLPDAGVPAPVPAARALEVVARRQAGHHPRPRWWGQLRLPAAPGWLQQLQERAEERWGAPEPIRRSERAVWAAASSLEDLGELTARWLTGDLDSQPGYYGTVDVDEDDAPGLTAALVAANEWGWWTRISQAGHDGPGYGGHWRQLAWVGGHVEAGHPQLPALVAAARAAGYQAIEWNPAAGRRVVTWFEGSPVTVESWAPPEELREQCTGLSERAMSRVLDSVQLSIIDPIPGRNTLWSWLTDALSRSEPSAEQVEPGGMPGGQAAAGGEIARVGVPVEEPARSCPWWVSWWHTPELGAFELHSPWWVSGFRETESGDAPSICAAVMAPSQEAARDVILSSYDQRPVELEWRFVEQSPADWSPFSDRFPRADWMQWPPPDGAR